MIRTISLERTAKMRLSPSKLRANIYRILDEVLETGVPVEIERKGKVLKIVPAERSRSKLQKLPSRPKFLRCDPEELAHLDWSQEWCP